MLICFIVAAADGALVCLVPQRYSHPRSKIEAIFSAPVAGIHRLFQQNLWLTL
jgi:hypothetical protein